jgi:hypothetical protein
MWPPLPIVVSGFDNLTMYADTIVERNDRVHHQIKLHDSSSLHSQKGLAAMQKPFPALTDLDLEFEDRADRS